MMVGRGPSGSKPTSDMAQAPYLRCTHAAAYKAPPR